MFLRSLPPLLQLAQLDYSRLVGIDQPIHFFRQGAQLTLDPFPFALLARNNGRITAAFVVAGLSDRHRRASR